MSSTPVGELMSPGQDTGQDTVESVGTPGGCASHYGVRGLGTLQCLLVAPHPPYWHYTADPENPYRFWTWTDEQAATLGRYRVNDLVRYVGTDPRWMGQQGRVLEARYPSRVPLVVELPGGPRGIGIALTDESVELVESND